MYHKAIFKFTMWYGNQVINIRITTSNIYCLIYPTQTSQRNYGIKTTVFWIEDNTQRRTTHKNLGVSVQVEGVRHNKLTIESNLKEQHVNMKQWTNNMTN